MLHSWIVVPKWTLLLKCVNLSVPSSKSQVPVSQDHPQSSLLISKLRIFYDYFSVTNAPMRWYGLFSPLNSITSDVGERNEKIYSHSPFWNSKWPPDCVKFVVSAIHRRKPTFLFPYLGGELLLCCFYCFSGFLPYCLK